jgi:hypothetical protein
MCDVCGQLAADVVLHFGHRIYDACARAALLDSIHEDREARTAARHA